MSLAGLQTKYARVFFQYSLQLKCPELQGSVLSACFSTRAKTKHTDDDDFRVLDLKQKKQGPTRRKFKKQEVMPPRTSVMPVDQDWGSVWPGPRTFHPASVPLPVRQGYNDKGATPGKFANAELMKIPNFLHLTPPVVKRQCEALKHFCTAWPQGLETDKQCEEAFPIEVITSDYCHSSPDIRDPLARIVTLKVKLNSLPLNAHAKDKLLRLVGERYNPDNGVLTIMTDRCPLRKQNLDYAMYLLTALFHESWKVEAWESEKSEADMEYYDWETSASRRSIKDLLTWTPDGPTEQPQDVQVDLQAFKTAVSTMMNEGEETYTLNQYKEEVKKLLSLSDFSTSSES
ncbi:small ribosomal subunit protein mS35 [Periplaneta americana]|uniref:small ribosomal subunit protein mS35 n=1 Tax=Periplaneta americana TaxID=6978 RepID=UPI0037E88428